MNVLLYTILFIWACNKPRKYNRRADNEYILRKKSNRVQFSKKEKKIDVLVHSIRKRIPSCVCGSICVWGNRKLS